MRYSEKAKLSARKEGRQTRSVVEAMITDIVSRGEVAVREYAKKFDGCTGNFLLSEEKKARLIVQVPQPVKDDIQFAHDQGRRFSQAQKESLKECEIESASANRTFGTVASRISPAEGMEGHARTCDCRLRKYFPDQEWPFEVYAQKRYE